ncbi:MAG TPA: terminase small subunit [Rudaea sp.]|nr:terminase small subunit [Rudaea sp.]
MSAKPTRATGGEGVLSEKRARFVAEYLVDLNATQAAIRAGYSERTAYQQGSRLLSDVDIEAAIVAAQAERAERTQVTVDRVLLELARIGFSDISNYEVDDDGNVTLVEGADPQAMRAVSTLKRKTRIIPQKNGEPIVEHDVEIKLWDKNTGLANCGKHLGMFAENVNLRTPDGPLQVHITRRIVRPNGDR